PHCAAAARHNPAWIGTDIGDVARLLGFRGRRIAARARVHGKGHAMKAMVLAAGKGTRVRPITNIVPKPMIPLIGKPIMQTIIEHLRDSGFNEIVVNTSHLAPAIEDYFGDGSNFG